MTATVQATEESIPRDGSLVEVRGQRWVVSDSAPGSDGSTLLTLQSVEDGHYGESLPVIWEVEPGRRILPAGSLPEVTSAGFDPPERLAAFLDAVRWSAVTSADVKTLQAPLRSGVTVEEYQLEPVARAIEAPRVNLLLADDVGLGKTIEAGLVALELLLRHRAKRIMIVCPPGLMVKWQDEMAEKFGLDFTIVDSAQLNQLRRSHGSAANPFRVYPLTIVSLSWLRGAKAERLLHEVIEGKEANDGADDERPFDLLILDEAHHVAPAAPKQRYAVDSQQTKLIRWLAPHFEHRLFLSATPHNGYPESFTALLEIIDDLRFVRGVDPDPVAQKETVVRRMKSRIVDAAGNPKFPQREARAITISYPESEREAHALLDEFAALRRGRCSWPGGRSCWPSWRPGWLGVAAPRRGWWPCAGWAVRARPVWRWSTPTATWSMPGWPGSSAPRTRRCWRPGSASWPPQLGVADGRDPIATVHAVLAASPAPWLLVFDNAPDRALVAAYVPPAGPGRVLVTSRNQIWPPGQALDVAGARPAGGRGVPGQPDW